MRGVDRLVLRPSVPLLVVGIALVAVGAAASQGASLPGNGLGYLFCVGALVVALTFQRDLARKEADLRYSPMRFVRVAFAVIVVGAVVGLALNVWPLATAVSRW